MSKVEIFKNAPKHGYVEEAISVDSDAFKNIVESRRSVRVFDDTKIPEKVMRECLRLALLAPNSSNLQTWEFFWVRDSEKKKKLVKYCFSQPAAKTAQELVVAVARPDRWKEINNLMLAKFDEKKKIRLKAAYQYYSSIVPKAYNLGPFGIYGPFKQFYVWYKGLTKPMPRGPFSLTGMRLWAQKSTALACQNFMLAIRAHGFDSCPMEGMDAKRVKALLDIPKGASICMVISAGKRSATGVYGPRVRFDQDLFIKEI